MQTAVDVFSILSKAHSVFTTSVNIAYMARHSKLQRTEEKVELAVEAVFLCFQAIDLSFAGSQMILPKTDLSKKIGVGVSVGTGLAHIGKTITVKCVRNTSFTPEDFIDIVAVVIFRAHDVVKSVGKLESFSQEDKDVISYVETGLNVGETVLHVGSAVWKIYRHRKKICEATKIILQHLGLKSKEKSKQQINVFEEKKAQNAQELEIKSRELVLSVINWKTLKSIPEYLHEDEEFQKYKCGITNLPIRFPVVIAGGPANLYFEKSAIENFRNDNLGQPPPSWPASRVFNPKSLIIQAHDVQRKIDQRLDMWAEIYKCELENKKNK